MEDNKEEAEFALLGGAALFFSGGCYDRKVIPVCWSEDGRYCSSAGGSNVVHWDVGGRPNDPPPVRKNHRAGVFVRNTRIAAAVTWLGQTPSESGEGGSGRVVSVDVDGIIMIHEKREAKQEQQQQLQQQHKMDGQYRYAPIFSTETAVANGSGPFALESSSSSSSSIASSSSKKRLFFGDGNGQLCVAHI
jgi:hypothetical protein